MVDKESTLKKFADNKWKDSMREVGEENAR